MADGCWQVDGNDVILAVRLTPRSAKERLGGSVWRDENDAIWLQAQVRAVPEKGRANAALIELVAGVLDVPASTVCVISGDTGRRKRLRVAGLATKTDRLAERLGLV